MASEVSPECSPFAKFETEPAKSEEEMDKLLELLLAHHVSGEGRWTCIANDFSKFAAEKKSKEWLKRRCKKLIPDAKSEAQPPAVRKSKKVAAKDKSESKSDDDLPDSPTFDGTLHKEQKHHLKSHGKHSSQNGDDEPLDFSTLQEPIGSKTAFKANVQKIVSMGKMPTSVLATFQKHQNQLSEDPVYWHSISNSREFQLAHAVCRRLGDWIKFSADQRIEGWEFEMAHALLLMLKMQWTTWKAIPRAKRPIVDQGNKCASFDSICRLSVYFTLQYLKTWDVLDFRSLNDSAVEALKDLEEVCVKDPRDTRHTLPLLRAVLAKLSISRLNRCASAEDLCVALASMLDDAKHAEAAIATLFEIAKCCQKDNLCTQMIACGISKPLISLMHRYAASPAKFKSSQPHDIKKASTELATIPNGLRKCLLTLGASSEGLAALADAGLLGAMAAMMELAAGMDESERRKHGLGATRTASKDWPSVFLATACALLVYVDVDDGNSTDALALAKFGRLVCTPQKKSVMYEEIMMFHTRLLEQVKSIGNRDALVEGASLAKSFLAGKPPNAEESPPADVKTCDEEKKATIIIEVTELMPGALGETFAKTCDGPDCSHKERDGIRFKVCSRCKLTAYCSSACQRAHWSTHRLQCIAR